MIPPPPQNAITLSEQRKRKKRFELAPSQIHQDSNLPKPSSTNLDLQIVPYLHYGLNRNMTYFTLLDKENILTKSPTLVSFGGSSFEFGRQNTLLMLDLDPSTKYSKDGGLDTSFEYDWKPIHTTNNHLLDSDLLYYLPLGNLIYSKRNQSIYIFGTHGWRGFWIASLSLKTLSWDLRCVSINQQDHELKFVISKNDEQFLICHTDEDGGRFRPFYFSLCSFKDLENIFTNHQSSLISIGEPIEVFDNTILAKMAAPLSDENKMALYGLKNGSIKNIHIVQLAEVDINQSYIEFEIPKNTYIKEIPSYSRDFKSKPQLLVTTSNSFYKCDINDRMTTLFRYSKPAIIMKHSKLFFPFMASFKTRKDESQIVYITNNDVLFILKLDYGTPSYAFRNKLNSIHFADISII